MGGGQKRAKVNVRKRIICQNSTSTISQSRETLLGANTSTVIPPLATFEETTTIIVANNSFPLKFCILKMLVQPQRGKSIDPSNLNLAQKASLQRLKSPPLNIGPHINLANHLNLGNPLDGSTTIWKLDFKDINNHYILEGQVGRDMGVVAIFLNNSILPTDS